MLSLRGRIELLRAAIQGRKQVIGRTGRYRREFCPHTLGRKGRDWHVLTWQFAGESRSGLPPGGDWRCFDVEHLEDLELRGGEWHRGRATGAGDQSCVDAQAIDIAVDPAFGPEAAAGGKGRRANRRR